jgi:hypothetical protein
MNGTITILDIILLPEMEINSIYWAQLSRIYLKTEIVSSFRYIINKRQDEGFRPRELLTSALYRSPFSKGNHDLMNWMTGFALGTLTYLLQDWIGTHMLSTTLPFEGKL